MIFKRLELSALLLARRERGAREEGAKPIAGVSDANDHLQIDESFGMSGGARMCFVMCQERFRPPFAHGRSHN